MANRCNGGGIGSGDPNGQIVWPSINQPSDHLRQMMKLYQAQLDYVSGISDLMFSSMEIVETKRGIRWEIIPRGGRTTEKLSAIVTNIHDGASLTVIVGKRVAVFNKNISESPMSSGFLSYLQHKFEGNCMMLIEYLDSSTPEQIDGERIIFSLTKGDKV